MADLSVIIPTYNSRDVLQKTLSAIFDQDLARDRYPGPSGARTCGRAEPSVEPATLDGLAPDVALLAFVLHHSADPPGTLGEARRVSGRVVILEDTYRSLLERASLIWTDWILNRGYHVGRAWEQLRPEQWTELLHHEPTTIVHTQEIPPRWLGRYRDPIRHVVLVTDSR